MEAIIFDHETVYEIKINENASNSDVLATYMRVRNESVDNNIENSYEYSITSHPNNLYSIRRNIKNDAGVIMYISFLQSVIDIDIADWWAQAYPIIEQISSVAGVGDLIAAPFKFVKWMRGKIQEKSLNKEAECSEYQCLKTVLEKDEWNRSQLANELSCSNEEAKKFLRGVGYVWDSHKQLFVSTEFTKRFREIKPKENYGAEY